MNKRQKEIELLLPTIIGAKIGLFHADHFNDKVPFLTGTVKSFTGAYLILENAEYWNNKKESEAMIHTNRIHHVTILK